MAQYLNIHDALDARRQEALKARGEGPRAFVVGPTGALVFWQELAGRLAGVRRRTLLHEPRCWAWCGIPSASPAGMATCALPPAAARCPQTWASPRSARSC